ncbi:TIGR03619 family F420-dependent LLM class oxidoreductase [Streptantibioticus silvisoli]|uniref:TIGR03619 family F420-dependent LLM class oxidoreductase n=1 Tax=Streptantibioticus silvisoli TaxID=2705255 RepID=A0ABT6W2J2_9ACTN|nr:TIGR03619 family F420-dependent LLM class oxidoreductase [Streptantibioticus silvisoli]MDI5964940.1 TIGR03619 family F420-dependent LLM class oxidoreductase [Streptantibioticus silvisoli]
MRIGFALPQFHRQAHGIARTATFASEVEQAGAASLWVGDRNLAAVRPSVGYGGRGNTIPAEFNATTDPFILLGIAASATRNVLLGTHVLVAPLYPPVQLARSLTTIDLVSGGRLLPGFGVGWSPEEFRAAGVDFARRGARMDEVLDALEAIWGGDPAEYHGTQLSVPLHHTPLKPVQRPRPPIYLGALSERALRRVARRADGWLPVCVVPGHVDIDGLLAQRALLDELAVRAGREPAAIDTVLRVNIDAGTGTAEVADTIRRVHERTGIEHFMVDSMYAVDTVDGSVEHARDVLERVATG